MEVVTRREPSEDVLCATVDDVLVSPLQAFRDGTPRALANRDAVKASDRHHFRGSARVEELWRRWGQRVAAVRAGVKPG